MGLFKGMKDMRDMVNAAPAMVEQAQILQGQANQMAYANQQAMMAQQMAAPATAGQQFPPIAGVSVEQYVRVVKGIAAYNYDQNMLPAVAAQHGIDAASWATASAGFNAQVTSNPAFAQHFNNLYRQA